MKNTILLILLVLVLGGYLAKEHPHGDLPSKTSGTVIIQEISNATNIIPPVKEINYFETPKDVENWIGRHGEKRGVLRRRSSQFATQGGYSMEIVWGLKRWGELVLLHFPQDWQAYAVFAFDVYYSGREPFDLELRIGEYSRHLNFDPALSRYVAIRTIHPGFNRLRFSMTRINDRVQVASGRKIIRLRARAKGRRFYIDNMRLER